MKTLFPIPISPGLSDDEIAAILRRAICGRGGRGGRMADLYLATLSAERLVDELRRAGAMVILKETD
jgi:hypothetical protein